VKILRSLYLTNRFFVALGIIAAMFAASFYAIWLIPIAKTLLTLLILLTLVEIAALFKRNAGISAERKTPERLSNGDYNEISVSLVNTYGFTANVTVIDEIPFQFQIRDSFYCFKMPSGTSFTIEYNLRPVKRGNYSFGAINVFVSTVFNLAERRFRFSQDTDVPVYPSYLQMRRYELLAISDRLREMGAKRIHKVGYSMEFDGIRQYATGDDYRIVNWKASARAGNLMVNYYTDEKSQRVYNVIDKGRAMKMPFEGMTLLDYAINAALAMAKVSLAKQDKAGLITFSHKQGVIIPADGRSGQMRLIQEALFAEKTGYAESNFEHPYTMLKKCAPQRSLVLFYTNFETLGGMERALPLLRGIAKNHLLIVIFFENTELTSSLESDAETVEDIYIKTIAEKFCHEKRRIVKELHRHGIQSLLTSPQNLTVNAINKYLEIKLRRMI